MPVYKHCPITYLFVCLGFGFFSVRVVKETLESDCTSLVMLVKPILQVVQLHKVIYLIMQLPGACNYCQYTRAEGTILMVVVNVHHRLYTSTFLFRNVS